jgi:hypothetical protein
MQIPLKRAAMVLLSGTVQSIGMSPTMLVLPVRRLLVPCCRAIAPDSGGDSAVALLVGPGPGCNGGHAEVSNRRVGVWETLSGRNVRRDESVRKRSRVQVDRKFSLSGEPE